MIVGFVRLWDLNDSRFCSILPVGDFKDSRFFPLQYFEDSRLGNEISKAVSFVLLWDFNDGWFCSVMRSQWR